MHAFPNPRIAPRFPLRLAHGLLSLVLVTALSDAWLTVGCGWHALAFLLAPDVALLLGAAPGLARGQLHPRAVPLYNALHTFVGPLLFGIAALLWLGPPWVVAAVA